MANNNDNEEPFVFEGKVAQFWLGGEHPKRTFITQNVPFGILDKYITIDKYNAATGRGEQRARVDSWVRKIRREMEAGAYTPTSISVCIRSSHESQMTEERGRASIPVYQKKQTGGKLPCLDGGHRMGAMKQIWEEGDATVRKFVENCIMPVIVYLQPDYSKMDFGNLQKGLRVDRSHLHSLDMQERRLDPRKQPFYEMAAKVARKLNKDKDSYLFNQIRFDSSDGGPLAFSSLDTLGSSDIGTSFGAGARIALFPEFNRDADFLASCYRVVWDAINAYDTQIETDTEDPTHKTPKLLLKGKMLRPTYMGGKKGGSSLLIGIGNVVAYRLCETGKQKLESKDQKILVQVIQDIFDIDVDGNLSGPNKRKLMGSFVRLYMSDLVKQGPEDEHNPAKLPNIEGVPKRLIDLTSKSTWSVDKEARERLYLGDSQDGETGLVLPDTEIEPDFGDENAPDGGVPVGTTGKASSKKRRKEPAMA